MSPSGQEADLRLVGGRVADVRRGAWRDAALTITGDRITAVGSAAASLPARETLEVTGQVIVPGYVEPHTHTVFAAPDAHAGAWLRGGTTTAAVDALHLLLLSTPDRLPRVFERLGALPVALRWLIRLHPTAFGDEERFALDVLRPLWRLPWTAAVGEVTRWMDVYDGDAQLLAKIAAARSDGRRVEGHAPGASAARLAVLAERGFTSCHEAITAAEVHDRLRAGLHVMLRHSPIRPDLPRLAEAVPPEVEASGRLMLTADGPNPAFVDADGSLDHVLAVALQSGIPPLVAYRMATLNPALYYGWDDRGEIAPGKRADLNVLRDPADPRPAVVIAGGRVAARDGRLLLALHAIDWGEAFPPRRWPAPPAALFGAVPPGTPACRLDNDVITQPITGEAPADALRVVLVDRDGRWATRCLLSGFAERLGGLATTLTTGGHLVVLGQDAGDMARAAARVAAMSGGVAVVEDGAEDFVFPFEGGGAFSTRPWAETVDAHRRLIALLRVRGYRFTDPVYSLMFLTFDSLPWIRLTDRGVWDVRHRRILTPTIPL